ncbi:hypothetical protein GCM10010313_46130 [Streptomyces violarus]|nr:hypothetical protein GCM10010313_46130 [Streptomyces violarus]
MHLPTRTTAVAWDGRPGEPGAALAINKPVSGQRRSVTRGRACVPGVTEDLCTRDMCDRKGAFVTQPGQRCAPDRRRGALTRHSDLFEPAGGAAVVRVEQVGGPAPSGAQPGWTDTEA